MTDIGVFFACSYHSRTNIIIVVSWWTSQYHFISVFLSWILTTLCIIIMKNKFLLRPSILIVKNYFGIHAQCMHAWVCTSCFWMLYGIFLVNFDILLVWIPLQLLHCTNTTFVYVELKIIHPKLQKIIISLNVIFMSYQNQTHPAFERSMWDI